MSQEEFEEEAIMVNLKALFWCLPGGTETTFRKFQSG
jgi:hypothetical protein